MTHVVSFANADHRLEIITRILSDFSIGSFLGFIDLALQLDTSRLPQQQSKIENFP
jgi:hypothetical protein